MERQKWRGEYYQNRIKEILEVLIKVYKTKIEYSYSETQVQQKERVREYQKRGLEWKSELEC